MRMSHSRAVSWCARAALVVLAGAVLAPQALAQEPIVERRIAVSVGGPSAENLDAINERALRDYARILKLDDDQKSALRGLMDGHRAARKELDKETQAKYAAINEKLNGDGADRKNFAKVLGEEMPKINEEQRVKGEALEKQFFDDLKALLSDEQTAKFPAVERHRRRETSLRSAQVYGASTDLVSVVRQLHGEKEPSGQIVAVLDQYELDLDRLLVERRRLNRESQKRLADMQKKSGERNDGMPVFEMGELDKVNKPIMEIGTQIRDLNRQTSARIAALMEGEERMAFEREVRRREFPRVYRTPHVVKAIEAAMAMSDLSESQKSELRALRQQYEREAAGLNDAWSTALAERQQDQGGMVIVRINDGGPQEKNPVDDAKKARKALDESFEQRLGGMLNEEQRKKLPTKTADKRGGQFVVQGGGPGPEGMPMELDLDDLDISVPDEE